MHALAPLLLLAGLAAQQQPTDPEQSPAGRKFYLGREIAQTMHWTGAGWLMRQTREKEENGALLQKWLALRPGAAVCDFGCGNGYHTLPMAKAVGAQGTVYAVDLQPQMLTLLKKRCGEQGVSNVQYVQATIDDPKLPKASCDQILLVDVYHELSHPVRVMTHLRNSLREGGRVTLVEFRAEDPDVPIKPEHMMAKAQVVREMASHGFELVAEFDELPWQHAMSFAPTPKVDPRLAPREVARAFATAVARGDRRIVEPFVTRETRGDKLPSLSAAMAIELEAAPDGQVLATFSSANQSATVAMAPDGEGRWCIAAVGKQRSRRIHGGKRPFVAMNTALGRGPLPVRLERARKLGFDGVAWGHDNLPLVRNRCENTGGDLWSAYFVLDIATADEDKLAPIRSAMTAMTGGPGMIWLALRHTKEKPRAPTGDDAAATVLAKLLTHADATGVEIAIYPHHGFWVETAADALRLSDKVKHDRLGICFNICHHLRAGNGDKTRDLLEQAGKKLFAVTINGADMNGKNWSQLIQPLGQGDWNLRTLLAMLDDVEFTGPIGLQGYGIRRPADEHLAESMAAWRAAVADK